MGFNFPSLAPIALLIASNVFMTFAWYWHLKFHSVALWMVATTYLGALSFIKFPLAIITALVTAKMLYEVTTQTMPPPGTGMPGLYWAPRSLETAAK